MAHSEKRLPTPFFPMTGELVPLFNPRTQHWHEHFELEPDGTICPLTAIGRATERLLKLKLAQTREMLNSANIGPNRIDYRPLVPDPWSLKTPKQKVLITHTRMHFENLAGQWWQQSKDHAGIVLAVRRANTHELSRRVVPVLDLDDQSGWRTVVLHA